MIALLKGIVELRDDPYIIVDVHGVGYKVLAAASILSSLHVGEAVALFTYTHVREDALELFGFPKIADLKLFEMLIGVSGVGPKTAIGIFALGGSGEIVNAIATNNVDFFTSVPRLGKKNAQKIIIELKNKIGSKNDFVLEESIPGNEEVIAALKTFGFSRNEAEDALRDIQGKAETSEEKIRLALKYLGK